MKIRLNEIPQEGRSYIFDRATGELNAALADIVGKHDYKAEMFIRPMGNAYELHGSLKTTLTEVCSKCGWDFDLNIERPIREILFEDIPDDRKNKSVHGNQSVNLIGEGPSMTPYQNDVFNLSDFMHETFALAEPMYPLCGGAECNRIDEVREIQNRINQEYAAAEEEVKVGNSAFKVLENLNLGKKQ